LQRAPCFDPSLLLHVSIQALASSLPCWIAEHRLFEPSPQLPDET
jgi:hypothetical protein